jgi:hypothetical protein
MELRDFVAETLSQIADGVKEAQGKARAAGARVNPPMTFTRADAMRIIGDTGTGPERSPVIAVEFDVAVVATDGTAGGASGKLSVAPLVSIKVGGELSSSTQVTNRVQFMVPVSLPADVEVALADRAKFEERIRREDAAKLEAQKRREEAAAAAAKGGD